MSSEDYQKALANVTGDSLGVVLNSFFAFMLPWVSASAALSGIKLSIHSYRLHGLRDVYCRKRDKLKAVLTGACIKILISVLTLGHDDMVTSIFGSAKYLCQHDWTIFQKFASTIKSMLGTQEQMPYLLEHLDKMRTEHEPMQTTIKASNFPVEDTKSLLGVDKGTAATWHGTDEQVAKNVVGVGAVQSAIDLAVDKYVQRPVQDKVITSTTR